MTPRDGALVGALAGVAVGLVANGTGVNVGGAWGIIGLVTAGLVLGAAAGGARRPEDFGRALFLPASRQ